MDAAVTAATDDVIGGLSVSGAAHEFFEMSLDNVCVAGPFAPDTVREMILRLITK